jgi:FtsZ-interacting cell division protein ZipA
MNYNLLLGIIYCIILVIIIFIGMVISKNMHSKCFRGGKKHKFEPRYTEEEKKVSTVNHILEV